MVAVAIFTNVPTVLDPIVNEVNNELSVPTFPVSDMALATFAGEIKVKFCAFAADELALIDAKLNTPDVVFCIVVPNGEVGLFKRMGLL